MVSSSAPLEHAKPMKERAAAAAQALLPGRAISQQEIQAMLEKNEAAIKAWNALHKQQPATTNLAEHNEWVQQCLTFRQQIGARLEVLASLADKQVALEDDKTGKQQGSFYASAAARLDGKMHNKTIVTSTTLLSPQPRTESQPTYLPPQVSTMASTNSMTMSATTSMDLPTPLTSTSMAMPNMTAPTMFPEPPLPTVGFASTNHNMFFPTESINSMQMSSTFRSTNAMAGAATSNGMSSGGQMYTPNTYITATSEPLSSSASYIDQQNYMMSGGMVHSQQLMSMSMPMHLAVSESENLFANTNYGMTSASNNVHTGIGNTNHRTNSFAVDPFMPPLGFGSDTSYASTEFNMNVMPSMSIQQQQVMGFPNGGNFEAQGASMMPNSFGYGSMPLSSNMMPQSIPNQTFQPTPHLYYQQNQLSQQQLPVGSMSLLPDLALYGDSNVNIFEGLTEDAFFPMQ